MRVHPTPENVTISDPRRKLKALRRLPHVFNSVLQLPFPSDANVAIEEAWDCFKFAVPVEMREVRAHVIEIHPGMVKVVIREDVDGGGDWDDLELEMDVWRFRLPACSLPGLATAGCDDGVLVVRVPKVGGIWGFESSVCNWN